jgi:hypothetical protein
MLRIFSHTSGFARLHPETDRPARSAPQAASSSRRIAASLRTMGDAWREALAAHRGYEHLTSRGMPHDKALRAALGIRSPANEVRGARTPAAVQRLITGTARDGVVTVPCRPSLSLSVTPALPATAQIGNLTYVR